MQNYIQKILLIFPDFPLIGIQSINIKVSLGLHAFGNKRMTSIGFVNTQGAPWLLSEERAFGPRSYVNELCDPGQPTQTFWAPVFWTDDRGWKDISVPGEVSSSFLCMAVQALISAFPSWLSLLTYKTIFNLCASSVNIQQIFLAIRYVLDTRPSTGDPDWCGRWLVAV